MAQNKAEGGWGASERVLRHGHVRFTARRAVVNSEPFFSHNTFHQSSNKTQDNGIC
jgi:hypothetical protein